MKLGYAVLMVAVGAMLMFAPAAMGAKADKGESKGHDKNAVYGKVTAVDTTAKTITIAVQGKKDAPAEKDKTITTNNDTKVFIGETAATIADVKEGVRVAVTLTADTTPTAAKIVIMPPREKKPK
jgi:hypothetical protein